MSRFSYFSAIFFLFSRGGPRDPETHVFQFFSYFGPEARNLLCTRPTESQFKSKFRALRSEQPRVSGTSAGSSGDEPRVSGHSANAPGEKPRVSGNSADAGGKPRAEYASDGPRRSLRRLESCDSNWGCEMSGRRTSGSSRPSLGLRFLPSFPSFPWKICSQKMSGRTPGGSRHSSSRHPRPSEIRIGGARDVCCGNEEPSRDVENKGPPHHVMLSCDGSLLHMLGRPFSRVIFSPAKERFGREVLQHLVRGWGSNFHKDSLRREYDSHDLVYIPLHILTDIQVNIVVGAQSTPVWQMPGANSGTLTPQGNLTCRGFELRDLNRCNPRILIRAECSKIARFSAVAAVILALPTNFA